MRSVLAALVVIAAIAGCSSSSYLVVEVRTDLRPGTEFARVRVRLGERSIEAADDGRSSWLRGVRAAEFDGLADETYRLDVTLLDANGAPVLSRPLTVRQRGPTIATVILARQCLDVDCDALDRACHFGRCVEPECSEERPDRCGERDCASAAECRLPPNGCLVPACTASGSCWLEPDDASCGADGRCEIGGVCAAAPRDAGGRDSGIDAGADGGSTGPPLQGFGQLCWIQSICEQQALDCPGDQLDVACDWEMRRGCRDGLDCLGVGAFGFDHQVEGAGLFCTSSCATHADCQRQAVAMKLAYPSMATCMNTANGPRCDLHEALRWLGCD